MMPTRSTAAAREPKVARGLLRGPAALHRSAPSRAFLLERDATLAFRPGRAGLALTCQSGLFLVTQEGDADDHVLGPGRTFRAAGRGRVVAWALRPGVLVGPAPR